MFDAQRIAAALHGRHHAGGGFLCRCPLPSHGQGRGDRKPSLSVCDGDDGRLLVNCFGGCDGTAVLDELRSLGLLSDEWKDRVRPASPVRWVEPPAVHNPDQRALAIWRGGSPIEGTLAERYLAEHRGLPGPYSPALRFAPSLKYPRSGLNLPVLVAAVASPDRKVFAVQATFLNPATGQKAGLSSPRWTYAAETGLGVGAIRLAPPGEALGLAEGTETALSATLLSGCPCWATLGSQRFDRIEIPDVVKELHLFADDDPPGRKAAEKAVARYQRIGRKVIVRFPPDGLGDWNDVVRAQLGKAIAA